MELHTANIEFEGQIIESVPLERVNGVIKIDYATGIVTIKKAREVFNDGFEAVQTNEGRKVGSGQGSKSKVPVPDQSKD